MVCASCRRATCTSSLVGSSPLRKVHISFACPRMQGMEQALLFYRDQLQLGRKQATTVPRTYATRGRATQR